MKYHFKIKKEGSGYWAYGIELKGCLTEADTKSDLQKNLEEVLNLYLDEPESSNVIFPLPKKTAKRKNIVAVECDEKIAFALLLRQWRLKQKLTQRNAAEKLGYKNIYAYQKLENSKTANPTLSTLFKIKRKIPELDLNALLGR